MIKFTKEEIDLCKQVAEKYKKERLELGDWYLLKLLHGKEQVRLYGNQRPWIILTKDFISLWTISDCLEFFEERGFYLEGLCQIDECEYELCISEMDDMGVVQHSERRFQGKTKLEACLKAVLAVVEEFDG